MVLYAKFVNTLIVSLLVISNVSAYVASSRRRQNPAAQSLSSTSTQREAPFDQASVYANGHVNGPTNVRTNSHANAYAKAPEVARQVIGVASRSNTVREVISHAKNTIKEKGLVDGSKELFQQGKEWVGQKIDNVKGSVQKWNQDRKDRRERERPKDFSERTKEAESGI